jgi:hypothetical protein
MSGWAECNGKQCYSRTGTAGKIQTGKKVPRIQVKAEFRRINVDLSRVDVSIRYDLSRPATRK